MTLDINTQIAKGDNAGSRVVRTQSTRIVTSTNEQDVWEGSAALLANELLQFQTSSFTVSVVSTSANDTSAGSGTRQITVVGVKSDLTRGIEVIIMNGLTPVVGVTSWVRINFCLDTAQGTYYDGSALGVGSNNGDITISGGGTVQDVIPALSGRSASSHYTIELGRYGLLDTLRLSVDAKKASSFKIKIREEIDTISPPVKAINAGDSLLMVEGVVSMTFNPPIVIPEKADIWFTATPDAINTSVSVGYSMRVLTL